MPAGRAYLQTARQQRRICDVQRIADAPFLVGRTEIRPCGRLPSQCPQRGACHMTRSPLGMTVCRRGLPPPVLCWSPAVPWLTDDSVQQSAISFQIQVTSVNLSYDDGSRKDRTLLYGEMAYLPSRNTVEPSFPTSGRTYPAVLNAHVDALPTADASLLVLSRSIQPGG